MSILKDYLPDVDYYSNAEEYLKEDDCIETDIQIVGYKKKFRIRALTLGQQMEINQRSLNDKGELQEDEFIYWTIVYGVTRPKFSHAQAVSLRDKNSEYVRALSDEIHQIGRISKTFFDAYLEEQKKLHDAQKAAAK